MEYHGPWADIEIPDASLYQMLFGSLGEQDAGKVAFDHAETGEVVTFGELKDQVDRAATWFSHRGVRQGDVVAIALTNCPQYAAASHAVMKLGAATTPVNAAAAPAEMVRQLRATGARLVVTNRALLPRVREASAQLDGQLSTVVLIDPDASTGLADGEVAWAEVIATPAEPIEVDFDPATQIACLPVSSGTSGLPKPVMLTHRNLVVNVLQFAGPLAPLGEDNSIVSFLPFSHIYALTTNMNYGLWRRFPQYTMTTFKPGLFAQVVTTRQPTILFVVPPVATFIASHPDMGRVSWSSVKLVVSGAAPLDKHVGEQLQDLLEARVIQGYGMTELSPVTHVTPIDRRDIGHDAIGMGVGNTLFRVVDPNTLQDVAHPAPGEWSAPGELWVKGPNAMLGYLDMPEETAAALHEGWVRTGDLVVVDHEGVTKVVDRIKELIKRRGFQVAPAELEALLVTHPEVADAAVLGIDARSGDQVPHALVVMRPGATATTKDVVGWLNAQVAQYKHLGGASAVEAIPRSAAGKILRRELPALLG